MQKNLEFPNSIKKKERIGVFMLLKLKIYYKTIAIKTVWYQHKVSHINQQNRLESPVRASHIYGQLILYKGAKAIQNRKDISFQQIILQQLGIYIQKKEKKKGNSTP